MSRLKGSKKLPNLSEEEKMILDYLKGKKFVYQNVMRSKFGFSKPKMTRLLNSLEMKGIIRRKRVSNRNKVFLVVKE